MTQPQEAVTNAFGDAEVKFFIQQACKKKIGGASRGGQRDSPTKECTIGEAGR